LQPEIDGKEIKVACSKLDVRQTSIQKEPPTCLVGNKLCPTEDFRKNGNDCHFPHYTVDAKLCSGSCQYNLTRSGECIPSKEKDTRMMQKCMSKAIEPEDSEYYEEEEWNENHEAIVTCFHTCNTSDECIYWVYDKNTELDENKCLHQSEDPALKPDMVRRAHKLIWGTKNAD
jgi:hypothetical protein